MRTALLLSIALLASPIALVSTAQADGQLYVYTNQYYFATNNYGQLVVTVFDAFGPVTTADVTLVCPGDCSSELGAWPTSISGNGGWGRGANGEYWFDLYPSTPGFFIVEASAGEPVSSGAAGFEVVSAFYEVYGPIVPTEAFVGQPTAIGADVYNNAPVQRSFEAWLVIDGIYTEYQYGYMQPYEFNSFQFGYVPDTVGNHTAAIVLSTGETTPEATFVVLAPAKLVSADVTASPIATTSVPLVLEDATTFKSGVFQVRYDPALVEVRSVTASTIAGFGTVIEQDEDAGVVTIYIASAVARSGDLTLATIEYAAVELHNTDSTLALDVLSYERAGGAYVAVSGSEAHFHGSILGATGDDVLRTL